MYLDKNSLIFGYPAHLIRKIFREFRGFHSDVEYYSRNLGISKAKATRLVNKLIKEGYLKKTIIGKDDEYFENTIKGNSLAMASFAPPITRRTAEKIVAELIKIAKYINKSIRHLYKVKQIAIFGSYLTDKDRINDIDVDIILERKFSEEIQRKKEDACISRAINEGKVFNTFIDQLDYPIYKTRVFLKHHSKALSIHYGDKVLEQTKHKIIYALKD